MNDPWTTPFDYQVQGGLRASMSQDSDGRSTILRPRHGSEVIAPAASGGVLADICIAPVAVSISSDTPNPITPHSDVTVTSVWNSFTLGTLPSYQWSVGGVDLTESAKHVGVHTAVLTITDFTGADDQNFTVTATGKCGTADQTIPLTT